MTNTRFLVALMCAAALGGCAESSTDRPPVPEASTDPIVMRGEAMYFERIAPPSNARLEVSLVNLSLADSPDAVIAKTSVDPAGSPPIAFELTVDPATLDSRMQYSLHASLRDGEGRLRFTSDESHVVTPGDVAPVTIRMKMVAAVDEVQAPQSMPSDDDAAPTYPIAARYRCGDRLVDVIFTAESVNLRYEDSEKTLPLARSASGARYAQDGDEFWSKGDGAMLTLGGERSDCSASDETTPWEDAKARGIAFRAVGNEPGWLVEIGSGGTPSMRLLLDYGERELVFDATTALVDPAGFRGEKDDIVAELRLIDADCVDPMSGESFPVRAELIASGTNYSGCGRHLTD